MLNIFENMSVCEEARDLYAELHAAKSNVMSDVEHQRLSDARMLCGEIQKLLDESLLLPSLQKKSFEAKAVYKFYCLDSLVEEALGPNLKPIRVFDE